MMGYPVLAYQFVAGLVDQLKSKLVGMKRNFEELLAKAWFEEDKGRELVSHRATPNAR